MKNLEIRIGEKYLYITEKGLGKRRSEIAYFEIFENVDKKKNVIALSTVSKEGEKFIRQNNYKIFDSDVFWYKNKKLKYKVMIVEEKNSAFNYLILIVPKLLSLSGNK